MLLDYENLRLIWWALLGILLIGFVITDGYDLGTMVLLPFVGKSDLERTLAIRTVSPMWEGNQVWLILGAGAIFAAWPMLYAAAFSGFYIVMFLALAALIVRPVGFKFRPKREDRSWRGFWEWAMFVGAIVDSVIFGAAFGNLFTGVSFSFTPDLHFLPDISLLSLLNPFALLAGVLSLLMIALHGATWLNMKASGEVMRRSRKAIVPLGLLLLVLYSLAGYWLTKMEGYHILGDIVTDGPSNPLHKEVELRPGAWLAVYVEQPLWLILPGLVYLGTLASILLRSFPIPAFLASAIVPLGMIGSAGRALFPFLLPSSSHPAMSLTVWDASSSQTTLLIMLVAVLIFLPIVLAYTAWIFRVLRGPVTLDQVTGAGGHY